jgi:ABC-type branched-subunit amino acid transport system substrate-binding protein
MPAVFGSGRPGRPIRVDRARRLGCALAAVVWLPACGTTDEADTLRIAAIISTTGPVAEAGLLQLYAAALAAEEINAAGGVLGRPLRLVHHDDGLDRSRAGVIAEALPGTVEPLVLGAVDSSVTLRLADGLVPDFVMVSASATSAMVGNGDDQDSLFRTCPSDLGAAALLAKRAADKGLTRLAIVYPDIDEEQGLALAVRDIFTDLGGTVSIIKNYTPGRADLVSLVKSVEATNPEAILVDGHVRDAAEIVTQYLTLAPASDTFWLFSDELKTPSFITAVGASKFTFPHEGIGVATAEDGYSEFAAAYRSRYGDNSVSGTYLANAYDAVYLLALAVEQAGATTPAAVRGALHDVSAAGARVTPADVAAALAAARAGDDIDYDGVSGPVDFDADGHVADFYDVWRVSGGQIEIVEARVAP